MSKKIMTMVTIGQIVISKQGRDKGDWFVVVDVAHNTTNKRCISYAWLVNGNSRPVDRPKKKKLMHIQPTKYIDEAFQNKIENGKLKAENSEVRKVIENFVLSNKKEV